MTRDHGSAAHGLTSALNIEHVRDDFPILNQQIYGKPLAYLDNAATTQKPCHVIDAIKYYYEHDNANVHRGVHQLSERATRAYEGAREKVRKFINAGSTREIVFVRGATEAINLVAGSYGQLTVCAGDRIVVSEMEHHSNIVPWQLLCERTGATLSVIPMNDKGELILDGLNEIIDDRTRLVAVGHVSNSLGTVNPVNRIIETAHAKGVPVLLDGAQATAHISVDVQALDVDFYVFSAHKMYGPTGIGALYAREKLLRDMPPYQGGGDMISMVTFDKTLYNELPFKFEAGTPNIAGAIGLGAAIDYLTSIGLNRIARHEHELLQYATEKALTIPDLRIVGTAQHKVSILSFLLEGIHPHDIGTILDHQGIAIRTGHHCAMPVMTHFGVAATARASFAIYNTYQEIDRLFDALNEVRKVFR
ncbi:MAG: cysteine desulfurase / selenocysteine lyase [Gammaproteobacteria bacterium]|nr:MAG: cysteine desulfurase / selenocysteine lyase [Gammaproteobacteria bacterium]TND03460.1 MAG: cysteine desulfurase / selenocysteine lyase [Gammaproteobacteria bacterium]